MRSNCRAINIVVSSGVSQQSNVLSVPVNGNLGLLPVDRNRKIKYIDSFVNCTLQQSYFLKYWDIRFQGLNRDGSLITENAGIIINPVSGDWGNVFVKDNNLDFVLSSSKSQIKFENGIELGGIRPLTSSLLFNNPVPQNVNAQFILNIHYE
jgi:hypothetical protein